MSTVQHDSAKRRFTYSVGDKMARIDYKMKSDDQIAFLHTETPPEFQGQGVASKMAAAALDYARDREFLVWPYCPFIEHYIKEHPEYQRLVDEDFDPNEPV